MRIILYLSAILAVTAFPGLPALAQVPAANFSADTRAGCSPLVVNFQDLSTGNPTSWSWNFGNSNTSSLRNPSATYFTAGTYTVSLTVTNANGTNTLTRTQYITVYDNPTVSFTGSPRTGCFPLPVQFVDASTPGAGNTNVAWQWNFGNGNTSTQRNPLAVYNSAGSFTVTLTVTNDKGCTKTFSRPNYVSVIGGVVAGFTRSSPGVCRPPATINFRNTSTGPPTLSYLWDFGDGNTSTLMNPSHVYTSSGTFNVRLITSSTAGCQDTAESTVTIGGFNTSFTGPSAICVNDTASFSNTSTPTPLSSFWRFGDGSTASGMNVQHRYSTPGTYTVWVYSAYSSCVDSTSRTITVDPLPVADFTAPVTSRCQPPLTVNFQDLTGPGATSWQWDFGDGGTSTQQNPTHTYTSYGNFNVRLIVTSSSGCIDTIVKPGFITVRRANISLDNLPDEGCIPYTRSFSATINSVDAVTSYLWSFGDGNTSTAPNPTHTYPVQGTYTVRLIITTSGGCTDTATVPGAIRVGSRPTVNFTASPLNVCARAPVQFTDLSAPADEWLWDFGDGNTSTLQNPTHVYTDTGWFTIRLIAKNNGCADSLVRTRYIHVLPPVARFDYTANCSNRLEFTFTDQSVAPLTWFWRFGDGTTSTSPNPVHTFPALGSYNVTLIVTNGSCTDSATQTVRALDENPDFTASQTVICRRANIVFTASNLSPAAIVTYYWNFGDGTTQTTTTDTVSHVYTVAGNYTVSLRVTDINGCMDSVSRVNYIRVNGATADFSATNNNGCAGLTTTFNDLSVPDGINSIVNWNWNFGDGTIQNFSGPPYQHTYLTADTFSVTLTVTDAAGCIDSITQPNIVITTDPVPYFISNDTVSCPGAGVAFGNYSAPSGGFTSFWDFGDGNTSTLTNPVHSYTAAGLYTVKLVIVDDNGCADSLIRNQYVRVDQPVANFTMSDSVGSCIPLEVQFTNTSSNFYWSYWDFGAGQGTSNLRDPVHYYSQPGTYTVKLVATHFAGCADSIFRTVTLYDTAGSRITYSPGAGCSPLTVTMNSFSPGPMQTYLWDFGDGTTVITNSNTIAHTYTTYGNFLPKLIMEDPTGCIIPLQGADTVNVIGADANFGVDNDLFCDVATVRFIDSTTYNDPIVGYSWSFGDGGSSSLSDPSHFYSSPGLYSVQLAIVTQSGCRDTATKPNLVRVVASPVIDIVGDTAVCVNSSAQHSGIFLQPDTSAVSWSWTFPNGSSSTQQVPAPQVYSTVGTFTLNAIAVNSSGCADSSVQSIRVNPLPTVAMPGQLTIQNGTSVTLPATYSPNTVSWIWSPSAGLSCANCPTPDMSPSFNTRYQVFFTDANGCSNVGTVNVTVVCKSGNLFIPNTFSPNGDGSNDVFYPRGSGLQRVQLLRIFNRWGEVVFERRDFPVNDPSSGWNGTYKGSKPQADVYVYQAEVFCENGELIRLNGNIALIL